MKLHLACDCGRTWESVYGRIRLADISRLDRRSAAELARSENIGGYGNYTESTAYNYICKAIINGTLPRDYDNLILVGDLRANLA